MNRQVCPVDPCLPVLELYIAPQRPMQQSGRVPQSELLLFHFGFPVSEVDFSALSKNNTICAPSAPSLEFPRCIVRICRNNYLLSEHCNPFPSKANFSLVLLLQQQRDWRSARGAGRGTGHVLNYVGEKLRACGSHAVTVQAWTSTLLQVPIPAALSHPSIDKMKSKGTCFLLSERRAAVK